MISRRELIAGLAATPLLGPPAVAQSIKAQLYWDKMEFVMQTDMLQTLPHGA